MFCDGAAPRLENRLLWVNRVCSLTFRLSGCNNFRIHTEVLYQSAPTGLLG